MAIPGDCRVIGIGHPDRGDDAAGRVVLARLRAHLPAGVAASEADGEATDLLDRLDGARHAILVDASLADAPPGTIIRFDAATAPLPSGQFGMSTHGFGLAEAIELGRVLNRLPERCTVFAIVGRSFDLGAGLSAPVAAVIDEVATRVLAEIASTGS